MSDGKQMKRVAWITGGSSGIGLAAARAFGKLGAEVYLSARDPAKLALAAGQLRDLGVGAHCLPLDVTERAACAEAAQAILAQQGRLDVLVNSAGLNVAQRSWSQISPENWEKLFAANVHGSFYCVAASLPAMRAQGSGLVINVSSWAGRFDSKASGPGYMSAKHAVSAMTRSLNIEELVNGIRAVALCPGEVATPIMNQRAVPPSPAQLADMLQVEDMEATFHFVASLPARVCVNEIVISPARNGPYSALSPAVAKPSK